VPKRRTVAAVAAFVALLLSATPASAHNGAGASFKGHAGHYTVYAYDGFPAPNSALTYRVVLLDRVRGGPAYDVRLRGTALDGSGTLRRIGASEVQVIANVAYLTLPNPYPHDVAIHLQLSGPPGRAAVSFRMHGLQPESVDPRPVVAEDGGSSGAAALGVVGGVLVAALLAGVLVA
jgi:hypothetical protein